MSFNNNNNNNNRNYGSQPSTFSSCVNDNITKVVDINPYNANNIALRLKVDNKSAVRNYSNAKGEGKMFSVDLVDDTGEIKCTFFNEAVDQYDSMFEVGKVFIISKASIKPGNAKFCRTQYEMSVSRNTTITEVEAPKQTFGRRYTFLPAIDAIQDQPKDSMIDCIGVMIEVGDTQQFTSKEGKEMVKKLIRIADQSNRNIEVTLWGEIATNFYGAVGSVLAIKSGRINEFKGEKNISAVSSTLFEIDPEIPEAIQLSNWYAENVDHISTTSHSLSGSSNNIQSGGTKYNKVETLASLQEQFNNNSGDKKPIFVKVKGTLTWINHDDRAPLFYKSCTDSQKKVVENTVNPGNGKKWVCEATGHFYDTYDCRYILSCVVGDTTGSQFVTLFNKEGEVVLGETAKNVESYKLNDLDSLNIVFEAALFKRYLFTIKATEEMYQDEVKLRCTVAAIEEIDYELWLTNLGQLNNAKECPLVPLKHYFSSHRFPTQTDDALDNNTSNFVEKYQHDEKMPPKSPNYETIRLYFQKKYLLPEYM